MQVQICPAHTKYTGKGKPTSACENCWSIWATEHPALIGPTLAELFGAVSKQEVNQVATRTKHGVKVNFR